MLKSQYPYVDKNGNENDKLIKHYSDNGKYIRQVETGIEYDEAIDVYPCKYTYEETDKLIDGYTPAEATEAAAGTNEELADAINALNILGVQ